MQASDLLLWLSGGVTNTNPNLSLGGDPAQQPVYSGTNNLFEDITDASAQNGRTDYRCIYLVNNSETETLFDASVYVLSQTTGGATASIGSVFLDDIQHLRINYTTVSGGSITVTYEGLTPVVVNWNADATVMANNIRNGLNTVLGTDTANGCSVTANTGPGSVLFVLKFDGDDVQFRWHSPVSLTNNLTGTGITTSVSKVTDGSPINAIAPAIPNDTTAPPLVGFRDTNQASPLELGNIKAGEIVPIWIKRVAVAGVQPIANDGFVLRISGNPVVVG